MKKDSSLSKIAKMLSLTKSEATFVFVVFGGLLLGFIYRSFFTIAGEDISSGYFYVLDSLAEVERSTYTGTDFFNNPDSALAVGDTIVEKESFFPGAKKKEITKDVLNINTASKVKLMKLPGVGEATALKIIKYREQQEFEKPEDIKNIKGIGEKKFAKMKDYIKVK